MIDAKIRYDPKSIELKSSSPIATAVVRRSDVPSWARGIDTVPSNPAGTKNAASIARLLTFIKIPATGHLLPRVPDQVLINVKEAASSQCLELPVTQQQSCTGFLTRFLLSQLSLCTQLSRPALRYQHTIPRSSLSDPPWAW